MKRVVLLGDSYVDALWPELLGVPKRFRQGIAGSLAHEWARDVGGRLSRAVAAPCNKMIISLGGNDVMQAMLDGEITDQEIERIYRDLEVVRDATQGKKRYVFLYPDPYIGTPKSLKNLVVPMNAGLRYVYGTGAAYIDLYKLLNSDVYFNPPDIHPIKKGQIRIADYVEGLR
jgi:hypothetical protein